MNKNKINLENIPEEIPIFPLSNAIFFPNTVMPLNIFEPRYKQMIEDAFDKNKFIGMAQPNLQNLQSEKLDLFNIGCVGMISKYNKTSQGTYLVNLEGVVRFKVIKEVETKKMYRTFKVSYTEFSDDLDEKVKKEIDDQSLLELIDKTKIPVWIRIPCKKQFRTQQSRAFFAGDFGGAMLCSLNFKITKIEQLKFN